MREDWDCLLQRAKDGDPKAFDAIVSPYRPAVEAFCRRFYPFNDEWCDAAQEALLRAWRKIDQVRGPERAFKSWLFKVVRTDCMNKVQGAIRHSAITDPNGAETLGSLPADDDAHAEVLQAVVQSAITDEVRRSVAGRIPPWDELNDDILVLLCMKLMLPTEIAEFLGVKPGTVRSRISRDIRPVLTQVAERFGLVE